ncbi:RHS repeat-associated core domain-containing protein [Cystobacter fuscus]|uniref:RHS repeat-associated core domain-containing protein n=1 Tax=Cystobacter fuscus TaxID=43 RepID=UPI001E335FEC|nr:RHS repeat-associated core domain-containing protein [Cystobacter fuscus]
MEVNGAFYNYYYGGLGRWRQKSYPGGTSDEFFYMGANQLLVDRESSDVVAPVAHYTQDDYVWLEGRPVVLVRGKLSNTWARLADTSADCSRNGEAAACGVYFPVTDHLGKPVLMLDDSGRVSGAVDYEPFGHVNRVGLVAETAHPLNNNSASSQTLGAMEQPTGTSPLANNATSVKMRALFHKVDLTAGQVEVVDANLGTVLASVSGTGRGRTWSDWVTPSTGRANVRLAWPGGPANTTSQGVVLEGYEYQRYQTGAQPFWMPLRFPGQYYDAETDLFENWNRYYDPSIGRYLQPEPILQRPEMLKWYVQGARNLPLYGYAGNNPVNLVDPTGKNPIALLLCAFGGCEAVGAAAGSALLWTGATIGAAWAGAELGAWFNEKKDDDSCPADGQDDSKSLEDIMASATPGRETKGRADQWILPGNADNANADFDALRPTGVRDIPDKRGRVGWLPDGRTVVVRPESSDGRPTLEIQDGKKRIKIRYGP